MVSVSTGQIIAIWGIAVLIWIAGGLVMAYDRVKSLLPLVLWTMLVLVGAIVGTVLTVRYYG